MTHFISPNHKAVFGLTLAVLILSGATLWVGLNSREEVKDTATLNWLTYSDKDVTFKYPETLGTKYITALDWPPSAQILDEEFSCAEAGDESTRVGRKERRTIDGREFCVTTITEGAAGSIYTQYAYSSVVQDKVIILTFSTQSPQCGNYEETQKTECEAERETFNIESVIGKIVNTLEIKKQNATISNFKECEAAGYPIMESYPRQCRTPDGRLFVEEIGTVGEFFGSIFGSVMLGPTCPVERDPPDPNCADRPYSAKFNIVKASSGQVVKTFTSDAEGKFAVEIAPGEYIIRRAANVNIFPNCTDTEVIKVKANSYMAATISCDTGIR